MPPSVDSSTCTPSACLTRSVSKKRGSRCTKVLTEDLRKKSRVSSSLSETSPRRSDNLDLMGQLTQESQQKRSSLDNVACVHRELPSGRPDQRYFPSTSTDRDFLKRAPFGKEERPASDDLGGSVRSMILRLSSLTRSTLVAYENERNQESRGSSTKNEALASELARLRPLYEAATLQSSQLRIANEAAAAEIANLRSENANILKMEEAASARLDEFRTQCVMRDAVNILAAFVMSKALLFKEQAELDKLERSEIDKLRFEKAQVMKEIRDTEEQRSLQILNFQSYRAAAESEVSKLSSEIAELMKDKKEGEAKASLANHDMLCRLEAANEEVQKVRLDSEARLREKDEAAAKAAKAAALELADIESLNERLLREMQTVTENTAAEIERLAGILKNVNLEKEEMAREKVVVESCTEMKITKLQSEKAALIAELEMTTATANCEFRRLNSRLETAVTNLDNAQHTSGLEKAKLESEIQAKISELEHLKKNSAEAQVAAATREAQAAAELDRLRRETDEGRAREAGLLEKLRTISALHRPGHVEMHLAFLINCGLIRRQDVSLNVMSNINGRAR